MGEGNDVTPLRWDAVALAAEKPLCAFRAALAAVVSWKFCRSLEMCF